MEALRTEGYLFMDESAEFNDVSIVNAKIGGLVTFQRSSVNGQLGMDGLSVSGNLLMNNGAKFNIVSVTNASVTGDLDLRESSVNGVLRMNGLKLTGSLLMQKGQMGSDVELLGARISGDFDAGESIVKGALAARDVSVDQAVYLNSKMTVLGPVNFNQAKVKGNLSLTEGNYGDTVDLSDVQIGGRFVLAGNENYSKMILTRIGFSSSEWGTDPVRIVKKISASLDDADYSSGFYDKLAKSYIEIGRSAVARSILIQKMNEEYRHADSVWQKVYLFIWWLFSGYGYKPEIGLAWIFGCVVIGAIIFKSGAQQFVEEMPTRSWFVFALDSVIPGIHLDKAHEAIKFSDWRQYVVYLLRFLGAILVFLVLDVLKQSVTIPK
jgi:hypothetical protein